MLVTRRQFNPPFNHINAVIELSGIDWTAVTQVEFMPQFNLHFIPLRRCGIEVNWMQAMNGAMQGANSISLHSVNESWMEDAAQGMMSWNQFVWLPFSERNGKNEWLNDEWPKGAINFSQFTFIQWNEWINWRNVTRLNGAQQLQLIASIHHARWSVNEWALMDCKRY